MKINNLKSRKKIIDISMVSIQFAGKGVFGDLLHPDTPLAPLFSGESGLSKIETVVSL